MALLCILLFAKQLYLGIYSWEKLHDFTNPKFLH